MFYTRAMIHFAVARPALPPKTRNSVVIGVFLAVILLALAILQLTSYDRFLPLLVSYQIPGVSAPLLNFVIVFLELLAVPFLLQMKLSPAMRFVSMIGGWFVIAIWLAIELWLILAGIPVLNGGLAGANVALPLGWWLVVLVAALGVLDAWATWGLWPLRRGSLRARS